MKLYVEMLNSEYDEYIKYLHTKDKRKATDYSIGELSAALLSKIKQANGSVQSETMRSSENLKLINRTVAKINADGYIVSLGIDKILEENN